MNDNRPSTIETVSAGGLIVSSRSRIAVVSQVTHTISLPKGHAEPGETLLETARREILEELGLNVGIPIREFDPYYRWSGRNNLERKTIVMFLFCLEDEPVLAPRDRDNPVARWLSYDEALSALSYDEDRRFLSSALASDNAMDQVERPDGSDQTTPSSEGNP